MYPASEKRFLKINLVSIITLFALILAGGIVRSSGSGMGCPDWPKCFDQYIPPTNISQLPADYKDKYIVSRVAKNNKFAGILDVFGFGAMANEIRSDKSILEAEEFNAANTWIEYINRLIGAIYGVLLISCVLASFTYIRSKRKIFYLSLLNLFLVGFQAWLGSIVVSTNLLAWVVTVHMLVAIAILAVSIYTYFLARIVRDRNLLGTRQHGLLRWLVVISVLITIMQITLGTTVREQIDAISSAMNYLNRSEWVANVGINFEYHRDLALLMVIVNIAVFIIIRTKYSLTGMQFKFISFVAALLAIQVITGVVLSYFGLPPVAQALHILLATLLFGAQFYLMLLLGKSKLYSRKIA